MIINGFGGDGRVQGKQDLIETITGTMQFGWYGPTYSGSYYYYSMYNAGYIGNLSSSSATPGAYDISFSIPSPEKYYGLGYRGIQYVPEVLTTSLTSGSFVVIGRTNSNQTIVANRAYGCAVVIRVSILGIYFYLIGRGGATFNANEVGERNAWYGHIVPANSLIWTLYSATSVTSRFDYIAQHAGQHVYNPIYFVGADGLGVVYWQTIGGMGMTNTLPNINNNTIILQAGCPENVPKGETNPFYDSRISEDNGGLLLVDHTTVKDVNNNDRVVSCVLPNPISVRIKIYGIN